MTLVRLACVAMIASTVTPVAAVQVVFRSSTDVVMVPVWVTDGTRAVSNLKTSDFRLTDNAVAQDVSLVPVASLPIDVTLALDVSGSVEGFALARFKADVQRISALLRPTDRVRLIAFASAAADVFGFQPGGSRLPLETIEAGGLTGFYNGLAAALMAPGAADRPQLVFALTDGIDTLSFLDADDIVSLAGLSGATVYIALQDALARGARLSPYDGGPNLNRLRIAAGRSGGHLYELGARTSLPGIFQRALEDFRGGYLLSYVPTGVAPQGWHEIAVRTTNAGYTVRARKGYEGS